MQCWGDGTSGDLGDGLTIQKNKPADVSGLTNVIAMSAGRLQTCAVLAGGDVDCWGDNTFGQLGNGSTTNASTPQSVTGLTGVVAIAAGDTHTCALTSGGSVSCWGDNAHGELGNGSSSSVPVMSPASVSGLSGVAAVAAGNGFTCALTSAGAVYCWGSNVSGELGDGSTVDAFTPTLIPATSFGGISIVSISVPASGAHACALTAGGAVYCWGYNVYGQLGDGSATNSSVPVKAKLPFAATATALGTGDYQTCTAVTGAVASYYCWGYGADYQLGDGTTTSPEKSPVGAWF
jgi:alpha-tubulin suppressor-like RCC1 family protein